MVYLGIFKIRLICLIFSVVGDEVRGVRMGKHKCLCMVVNLFPDVHRYAFLEWTFRYVIFVFYSTNFFLVFWDKIGENEPFRSFEKYPCFAGFYANAVVTRNPQHGCVDLSVVSAAVGKRPASAQLWPSAQWDFSKM